MPAKAVTCKIPATRSPEMNPAVWGRLPEDLLERILALLPLKTLLNLRPTCKHFNSLLFSPSFLSLTKTPLLSSFLLLSHPQSQPRFPLYDAFLDSWRTLALTLPLSCAAHLISTSNGLLCFSLPNSFLICNFLTKSMKTIQFPSYPFSSTTVISSSSSHVGSPSSSGPGSPCSTAPHGYKIFTLNSASSSAFVYDSGTDSWTQFNGFGPILNENSHRDGVFFNGSLYFTTREPFSVVEFELEKGRWEGLAALMPIELTFARLVSGSGAGIQERKLFMVGGVGQNGISRNLKVWELGEDGRNWVEIGALPELMCRKLVAVCYHNYEHVYCLWHNGLICVCCYNWPEILVYKVSRRTWHWLPRCPFLPEKWSCGFRWFSFTPDLYALV
ncbi:F-box/kelch-repeat-like protein [Cinnamomum micranthum f. kanehirae]|uniref:F-box/kelch-repeat-like protein n=1 Tax=Cinnamomum micranthum f. kanehirae TaxID=337451 RepID=A0A443NVC8_9MAGN|nr:F-box/kelch-repeat-like protein [Cinnamomum micranthum f. kanehirae]